MKPFIGLVKKELLISRFWYITWLIVMIMGVGFGTYMVNRVGEISLIIPIILVFVPLHVIFTPIMIFALLRKEGKTQLWLYNPQSSAKLLLAKLLVAITFQIISQVILTSYGLIIYKWFFKYTSIISIDGMETIILGNIGILAMSLMMAVWIIFLWSIYHSLGKYPSIKNFRWLIVIAVVIVYNLFETSLMKLKFLHDWVNNWTFEIATNINLNVERQLDWEIDFLDISIPVVPIIYETLLTLILFFIATRLLDKKVEV